MSSFGFPLVYMATLWLAAAPLHGRPGDGPPPEGFSRPRTALGLSLDPESVGLSLGGADVFDDGDRGEASWEVQFPSRRLPLWPRRWPAPHPIGGVLATTDGSIYPYLGLGVRFPLSPRFWFTPSVAAGAYLEGHRVDLGAPIEFRSRAEIVYQISPRARLGLAFSHLSNGGIRRRNPGTETLSFTFYSSLKRKGWGVE